MLIAMMSVDRVLCKVNSTLDQIMEHVFSLA